MDKKWNIINVEAVIVKDARYLMIKRSDKESHAPGVISFVGGKVEGVGEETHILEKSLKREIKEEVGIEVEDIMAYVASSSFISDGGNPVVDIVFWCKYKSGEAKVVSKDEVAEVYWMSSEEIQEDPMVLPWVKEVMKLL